jgi:hypothetical protein
MFTESDYCLSIKPNDEQPSNSLTFRLGNKNVLDLDNVKQPIHQLQVIRTGPIDREDLSLLDAAITKLHIDSIKGIQFRRCHLKEMVPFLNAVAERRSNHLMEYFFDNCGNPTNFDWNQQLTTQHNSNDVMAEQHVPQPQQPLSFSNDARLDGDDGVATSSTIPQALVSARNGDHRNLETKMACYFHIAKQEDHDYETSIRVCHMFNTIIHQKMVTFGLLFSIHGDDHDGKWRLFQAANQNKTLESIHIRNSNISMESLQVILRMCQELQNGKELTFSNCMFPQNAMTFLIQALSSNKLMVTLNLEHVKIKKISSPTARISFRNLQVRNLGLIGTRFKRLPVLPMMTEIANNGGIQSLDLSEVLDHGRTVEAVCDVFLRQNRGPSVLAIHVPNAEILTEALRDNTSVKTLRVTNLSQSQLVTFAQGVATMRGLRTLSIGIYRHEKFVVPFFQALEHSMEHNTVLCKLCLHGRVDFNHLLIAKRYLPKIRYLLATNLVGRHTLMMALNVPLGLWAHVLARSTKEVDGVYFALTEYPEIVLG